MVNQCLRSKEKVVKKYTLITEHLDEKHFIKTHLFYDKKALSKEHLQAVPYGQFRSYTHQTVMLLNVFLDKVGIYDTNLLNIERQMMEESQILPTTYRYWSEEILSAVQSYGVNSTTFVT